MEGDTTGVGKSFWIALVLSIFALALHVARDLFAVPLAAFAVVALLFGSNGEIFIVAPSLAIIFVCIVGLVAAIFALRNANRGLRSIVVWLMILMFIVGIIYQTKNALWLSDLRGATGATTSLEALAKMTGMQDEPAEGGPNAYRVHQARSVQKYLNQMRKKDGAFPKNLIEYSQFPGYEEFATSRWAYEVIKGGDDFVLRVQLDQDEVGTIYLNSAEDTDGVVGSIQCSDGSRYFCLTSVERTQPWPQN